MNAVELIHQLLMGCGIVSTVLMLLCLLTGDYTDAIAFSASAASSFFFYWYGRRHNR